MSSWISIDDRMRHGLKTLDQIENSKLRLLINRICQSMQAGISDDIFSAEEEEKLMSSLGLEKTDLTVLLQTITFIYSKAAFHIVKPVIVESTMKESFSIGDDKVAILSHAWITHAQGIVDAFKHKSIFPSQVSDVNWTVDVKAASSINAKTAKPVAKLQLSLSGSGENDRVTVEMDKNQLWDLYNQLDDIQSQLEFISKEK
ncbi:COMM domain-containing protein 10-like [Phymastichus coffea]|uniref:COMM domain-containing protein 10-like n=1 Tax=Phymastichus coffea TaxID=108790 RepID=UPI00273ACAEB|nr:COMM domain-containing protein 10-like [Phymastichus coffea]